MVKPGERYLVDASGRPFLIHGGRAVTVDLGQIAGPQVAAHWYNPSNGQFVGVSGSPFRATGSRRLQPTPDRNSSGFDDWVLILQSSS
jgi:Putative collagen-binding domain of a collagenase